MIKLQQNRYLWVHFTGLAFVPLLLDICLAGLASAGPALPFGGQFWAIALLTITPALTMQWLKPFYIFSLPPVALKPAVLSEEQRRCLQIFKSWQIKGLAIAVAIFSLWLLAQLYAILPQVSPLLSPRSGLVSAAIAFFLASTFMQISVSAARALLISPTALKRVAAVEGSEIASDFLITGIKVSKLLPYISNSSDLDPGPPTENKQQPAPENAALTQTVIPTEPSNDDAQPLTKEPTVVPAASSVKDISKTDIVIPEKLPLDKTEEPSA